MQTRLDSTAAPARDLRVSIASKSNSSLQLVRGEEDERIQASGSLSVEPLNLKHLLRDSRNHVSEKILFVSNIDIRQRTLSYVLSNAPCVRRSLRDQKNPDSPTSSLGSGVLDGASSSEVHWHRLSSAIIDHEPSEFVAGQHRYPRPWRSPFDQSITAASAFRLSRVHTGLHLHTPFYIISFISSRRPLICTIPSSQ